MNGVENVSAVRQWHQWTGDATCHVAQQAGPLYLDSPHWQWEEDLVSCIVLGQLAWLAPILGREMPAAGCMSATPAAMPGSEVGEEFSLPPCRVATPLLHSHCHMSGRPGEGVCHHVGCPGDVANIRRVFCHVGQLPGLACHPRVLYQRQGLGERLVVHENGKTAAIQHVPEMYDGGVAGKMLSVKSRVLLLGSLKLL